MAAEDSQLSDELEASAKDLMQEIGKQDAVTSVENTKRATKQTAAVPEEGHEGLSKKGSESRLLFKPAKMRLW